MSEDQPNEPTVPEVTSQPETQPGFQPAQATVATPTPVSGKKPSVKWPIIMMAWPAATIVVVILLYAIINLIVSSMPPEACSAPTMFGDCTDSAQYKFRAVFNVILFLFGAASVALGPISFIVGLVLLIQRTSKK